MCMLTSKWFFRITIYTMGKAKEFLQSLIRQRVYSFILNTNTIPNIATRPNAPAISRHTHNLVRSSCDASISLLQLIQQDAASRQCISLLLSSFTPNLFPNSFVFSRSSIINQFQVAAGS